MVEQFILKRAFKGLVSQGGVVLLSSPSPTPFSSTDVASSMGQSAGYKLFYFNYFYSVLILHMWWIIMLLFITGFILKSGTVINGEAIKLSLPSRSREKKSK